MNQKKTALIGSLLAFSFMSAQSPRKEYVEMYTSKKEPNPNPHNFPYFKFDSSGEITEYEDMVVYSCYALNLKVAKKKFKKWNH